MPSKSKAQERFMAGVAHGNIPPPKGLSRAKAAEFVGPTKGLPERVAPKKSKAKK